MTTGVEEFFNRMHAKADGKFTTSGTGGGNYKGRAAGAKRPGGSGGANKVSAQRLIRTHAQPKGQKVNNAARPEYRAAVDRWNKRPTPAAKAALLKAQSVLFPSMKRDNVSFVKKGADKLTTSGATRGSNGRKMPKAGHDKSTVVKVSKKIAEDMRPTKKTLKLTSKYGSRG